MFGQWCPGREWDFEGADLRAGGGVAVVPVDATGAVGSPLVWPVSVFAVPGAAAPAMPAAAPPVASAPATIVAPSIFEMRMRPNLLTGWVDVRTIVALAAKPRRRPA
jgi:hypothetical protein